MGKVILILTLFLPDGRTHVAESVWYGMEDCQRAAVRLSEYILLSRIGISAVCEYIPSRR